ncbi:transposase, MuDR [Tanacetum coccineum]
MECKIRHDNANYKMLIGYEKDPGLFSLKIYHAGKFKYVDDKRKYVNGLVAYVDWCDIDKFSVHEIHGVMEKLGYVNDDPIYYHYLIPGTNLDMGLRALGNDLDVRGLEYTPTVNVEDQVVANENANETVDGIMQELLSMNYEFDPFGCEQEETRVVTNEPEETLVEGETVLDGEEDSGTEEDESDDEDYLFDEDTYLEEVNVDMADYHFNIDADVEWIRHSESVQEPEYDVNPDDLDVIDTDNFESGTDSDDDGIEKVRRKKLKQIKKAKESEDNIVHKHFFFVGQTFASADDVKERVRLHSIETRRQLYLAKNDKVRIRAKCFGRNPVFILDGEGPSTTDVGPNKKGINSGGRGRPKPLAPDECPWAVQITKVKNSETWEVRTYNEEHKCLQSRKIIACTHKFLSKGIVDQVEKNPDIPIRALQEELQRKYELGLCFSIVIDISMISSNIDQNLDTYEES